METLKRLSFVTVGLSGSGEVAEETDRPCALEYEGGLKFPDFDRKDAIQGI